MSAIEMRNRVKSMNRQFNGHIETLQRVYPMHKLNPNAKSYETTFLSAEGAMDRINGNLHSVQMQARDKIRTLNRSIKMLDNQIDQLTSKNSKLGKRNSSLTDAKATAVEQTDNYTSIYRSHIFSIAALFGTGAVLAAKML